MDFDFDDLIDVDGPVWFNVTHPDTEAELTHNGVPVRFAILGPDTKTMEDIEDRIQNRRLKRAGRTGKLDLSAGELREEDVQRMLASIVGWENVFAGGKEIAFSVDALRSLHSKRAWVFRFWATKYRQQGNFLGTAASTRKK